MCASNVCPVVLRSQSIGSSCRSRYTGPRRLWSSKKVRWRRLEHLDAVLKSASAWESHKKWTCPYTGHHHLHIATMLAIRFAATDKHYHRLQTTLQALEAVHRFSSFCVDWRLAALGHLLFSAAALALINLGQYAWSISKWPDEKETRRWPKED